jgi:hypothetical protein
MTRKAKNTWISLKLIAFWDLIQQTSRYTPMTQGEVDSREPLPA